jgi:hypothetical protein
MSQRPSLATACKRDQRETGQIHRTPRALPLAYRRCAHMSLVHTAWLMGRDGKVPINDCRDFCQSCPRQDSNLRHTV